MSKATVAVTLGVVLLLIGFAVGTWKPSTSVDGVPVSCGSAIEVTRLPYNDVGAARPESAGTLTARARREETACEDAELSARLVTWTALGLGGLVALAGWTAMRQRGAAAPAP